MTKIVDLSHLIVSDPPDLPGLPAQRGQLPGPRQRCARVRAGASRSTAACCCASEGPAGERLSIGTHSVTHLDAPYHYNSTIQGRPSETIDELPLDWFFAPGVVVDALGREDGDAVTAEQMQAGIDGRRARAASPGHRPGAHRHRPLLRPARLHAPRSRRHAEATRWLWEQGVRVMGIDAWGWDAPLRMQAELARERNEPGIMWAAHQVDLPYSQIERLTNLAALPKTASRSPASRSRSSGRARRRRAWSRSSTDACSAVASEQ